MNFFDTLFVFLPSTVRTTIVSAGGFEYQCGAPAFTMSTPPTVPSLGAWLPPDFGYAGQVPCEVPNTATDLLLKMAYVPSREADDPGFFVFPLSGSAVHHEMPSLADLSQSFPVTGESGSIEGIADVQLASARYDNGSAKWTVALNITNVYGYDLQAEFAHVGVFSDSVLHYQQRLSGGPQAELLTPDIPPGLEKTWELTIQGDATPSTILLFGLSRPDELQVFAPSYVLFRLQQP
jgi:hypothetical protein